MSPDIREARNSDEIDAALDLRRQVFCGEQGVPEAEEIDGRDPEAQHLVAVEDGRVVATCRLLHEEGVTKLGRMAVAPEARRRGIATRLLRAADAAARANGSARIVLHAQTDARSLYRADGYLERGSMFFEAGIEHITMEKEMGRSPSPSDHPLRGAVPGRRRPTDRFRTRGRMPRGGDSRA